MQQQQTPAGPLNTPQALRRSTGAHAILVSLILADLIGLLLALLLGALFGALLAPPARWLFQASRVVLHASLPLDIAALVILCCLANAILRQYVQNKDAAFDWGCTIVLFLVVAVSAPILFFAKQAWIAIPSPVFPPAALAPLSWSPPPSALGIEVAAGLFLLAHIRLWQRERHETAEKLRTFSRAHHVGPKPEQVEVLMPLVARLLHDYNSPVALVEQLLRMADLAKASVWCSWLLPLPVMVARSGERRWQELDRERVLDRDRFAWQCGEAGLLHKLLARQLGYLNRTGKPDNTVPTLAERLDYLDSLRRGEGSQVKELRATLPPASPPPPAAPSP